MRIIVWFRNDLRVLDNSALEWAIKKGGQQQKEIVPVFSFDPRFFRTKVARYDSEKCGIVRARFIRETI
jgi:deoxyribodipyrimidine photolyase